MKISSIVRTPGPVLLAVLLASVPLATAHAQATTTKVGDVARNFTVFDHATGAPLNLSDYAGQVVVLNFFSYWSTVSQGSSALVETEIQRYYAARGGNAQGVPVQVLSISTDLGNHSATETFIHNAAMALVGEDAGQPPANVQFDTGLIPVFAVINGVPPSGPTGSPQWQILSFQSGYPGAAALRRVIDSVPKPAVSTAPVLQQPPTAQRVIAGQPAFLSVVASGWPTPTYQWLKDNVPISGATGASLWIPAARAEDAGSYAVIAANSAGSVTSAAVTLGVFSALVTPASKAISTYGSTYQVGIASRGDWSATTAATWLSLSAPTGSGNGNLTVVAEPNPAGTARTGTIAIGDFVHTVTQAAASATVSELWAVGSNGYGQLGDNLLVSEAAPVTIASQVAAIAAGDWHTLYVTADGTLWATGQNEYGQLGDGSMAHRGSPVAVATGVRTVSCGTNHTLFLKTDGTLWGMGDNSSGQIGPDAAFIRSRPLQIASGVEAIDAGNNHSLFLKTDGTLWGMGDNSRGQLGDGSRTDRATPVQLATGVQAFSAGGYTSFFVKADGWLWAVGGNQYGELGLGTSGANADRLTPAQVATNIVAVSAGFSHCLFLRADNSLWGMGSNSYGRLGDGSAITRTFPVQITTGVKTIAAGRYHSYFLKTDHTAWSMGDNENGQLGVAAGAVSAVPRQVAADIRAIAAGGFHSLLLGSNGDLQAVGSNSHGQIGNGRTIIRPRATHIAAGVDQAAPGDGHALWIAADGTLWGVGNNSGNPLGTGDRAMHATALPIATRVAAVATGFSHSLFVKADGTLWGMGDNSVGQLGAGLAEAAPYPLQIATGVRTVAAGVYHSLFVKADGTLWAMGDNSDGQLGDGTTIHRTEPVQVASGVRQVAANGYHSLFVKNDGTLWAMGNNLSGQLGDGSTANRSLPVLVASGVLTTAAGQYHSLFATSDGTLWGMGYNGDSQIAPSGVTNHLWPVRGGSAVQALAAGTYHSAVLTTDGSLWTLGRNSLGQLGNGTTSFQSGASRIAYGISTIGAGGDATMFVLTTGPLTLAHQPASATTQVGGVALSSVTATGTNLRIYQWYQDGSLLTGAVNPTLTVANFQPADTGLYSVLVQDAADTVTSSPAILGVATTAKVIGEGTEVGANIVLANGRAFDQVLLQGPVASVTADAGQVTRISYVDMDDDIVQVEFAGAGTLTLALRGASGPAAPVNYNQAGVGYMKGHASIVIVDADETTNVSVFSVGRANAVNQALFRADVHYDGVADVASIAILSRNGQFGGLRAANANFQATQGVAGIYAPGVEFVGPVYVGDINGFDTASAMLVLGSATGPALITGGDLAQDNGRSVEVSGLSKLTFSPGSTSHGDPLPAQSNRARLMQNGVDVTAAIVVNPTP